MYRPSLEEFRSLAREGNLVPVYRELNADLETPVSAFLKVARPPYAFLLESVEGGERLARYSFIGTEPRLVLATGPGTGAGPVDPLERVRALLEPFRPVRLPDLPRFVGGAVGYLAYEAVRHFEPRVPHPGPDPLGMPEALFLLTDTLLAFDHLRHRILIIAHADLRRTDPEEAYRRAVARIDRLVRRLERPLRPRHEEGPPPPEAPPFASNMPRERFLRMVERAREYIVAGDIIQVVLSQRFSRPTSARPFDVYRAVRALNPSPYMFFLALGDAFLIGASPEMLVRVEDGRVETHPIAGTRPRGRTPEEDRAYEEDLRSSEKERAEHVMLVDLGRNDLGRVAEPGTVQVTQLMEVERYSHVMHLVSHVVARLRPGLTCYDALRACFPAGTVAGAPKIRAMEIIAELEGEVRGPYAGAVGYFSFDGNMDTCITIRTMVLKGGMAHVQAGAGIVYDSDPEAEYQETVHKARALTRALERAEGGL